MSKQSADEHPPQLGTYSLYKPCMARLETVSTAGIPSVGAAFHIGDGYFVTARHVVENREITAAVPEERHGALSVEEIVYPNDRSVDLALLRTDFSLDSYMAKVSYWDRDDVLKVDHIQIGGHLNDWIDDGLVLMPVTVFGYPPIPTSSEPILVAANGEVNAVIDPYLGSTHPLFVVSPLARGGFSGGPVLTADGWLLGTVVSSLVSDHAAAELGFSAALTVEPLWNLLLENRVYPASNADLARDLFDI